MKNLAYIILYVFLFIGCDKQHSASSQFLNELERTIEINPDSAKNLLDSISVQGTLKGKSFAHWCMLSGKITDKLHNSLLPAYQFKRASEWYLSHGTAKEQAQILLYLGRAYAEDGDYDKAMSTYTVALETALDNRLTSFAGYTNSYMGVLYEERGMREQALDKFKTAAEYFEKEGNDKSYACALRDVGRQYACMDSLPQALTTLCIADSIASQIDNKNTKASIINTIGGIYLMQKEYDKSKAYYNKALDLGTNKMPNYMGLIKIYIETDSLDKAKLLLQNIPQDNPRYVYSIKHYNYLINKQEKQYEKALNDLEEYTSILDSIWNTENQLKILNIEKKYNDLKNREKINELTINQQKYIIILAIFLVFILLTTIAYLLYLKRAKEKIQKQQRELNEIKTQLLHLSLDLEKKKARLFTLEEKDESYNQMKNEIADIISNYKKLQNKMVTDSSSYKELVRLANQHVPRNDKALITEKQWKLIVKEITGIYPNLFSYILDLCPELSDKELQYCCFCMFGFDTNSEAKLLNINVTSVKTKRFRFRQKLNITLCDRMSFQEYIAEKLM